MRSIVLSFALLAALAPAAAETEVFDPRAAVRDLLGPPRYHACLGDVEFKSLALPGAGAQAQPTPLLRRLVVLLDSSGSMAGRAGAGQSKMEVARAATTLMLQGVPKDVSVGLVAFGHRGNNTTAGKAASCEGVETLYPIGSADPAAISRAVNAVSATGWTPLAAALEHAGGLLEASDQRGEQVVWVVSDGKETCGGDPVAAARRLHDGAAKAVINIVGYDLPEPDRAALKSVAAAGGGPFSEVRAGENLSERLRDAARRVQTASSATQVTINANETAATRARNAAMTCFTRQRNDEQQAFTAFRNADNVSRQRSRSEAQAMLSTFRARIAAGRALIEAYQAKLGARVEDREASLREALGDYSRALLDVDGGNERDTLGSKDKRKGEPNKQQAPDRRSSNALESAERSIAALGPAGSAERDAARFLIDQVLTRSQQQQSSKSARPAVDPALAAELDAVVGSAATRAPHEDIYSACLADKGIKETRWSQDGLDPENVKPGQREAMSAQALSESRQCMDDLLGRERAALDAAVPAKAPDARRALRDALARRHAYARDLLIGYERGLRLAVERYRR